MKETTEQIKPKVNTFELGLIVRGNLSVLWMTGAPLFEHVNINEDTSFSDFSVE